MKLYTLLALALILNTSVFTQEPKWLKKIEQVKLLVHTYDDVIQLLGKPIDGTDEKELSEYFDLDQGRVFVDFASGRCVITPESNGRPIGWKVPKWTAISISFSPNKPISPKKLGFDITRFQKYPIQDVPNAFVYENSELGIDFSMNREGKISHIGFSPPSKLKHLQCD